MRMEKLAATLRRIAQEGARGFYEGPVARDIVGRLRELGGLHTLEDFAGAAPDVVIADQHPLPRLRRLRVPARRPGTRRADDAERAQALRRRRPVGPRPGPSLRRGVQAGLPPPRRAVRRSGARRRSRWSTCSPTPGRPPPMGRSTWPARSRLRSIPRSPGRSEPRAQGHGLPLRGRPGRQRHLADQLDLPGVRLRHHGPRERRAAAQSRPVVPHGGRPPQHDRPGQAPDAHHHPRHADEGRPRGRAVRRDGRALSGDGPCRAAHRPARPRPRPAGGPRCAAQLRLRWGAGTRGRPVRPVRRAQASRPRRRSRAPAPWAAAR